MTHRSRIGVRFSHAPLAALAAALSFATVSGCASDVVVVDTPSAAAPTQPAQGPSRLVTLAAFSGHADPANGTLRFEAVPRADSAAGARTVQQAGYCEVMVDDDGVAHSAAPGTVELASTGANAYVGGDGDTSGLTACVASDTGPAGTRAARSVIYSTSGVYCPTVVMRNFAGGVLNNAHVILDTFTGDGGQQAYVCDDPVSPTCSGTGAVSQVGLSNGLGLWSYGSLADDDGVPGSGPDEVETMWSFGLNVTASFDFTGRVVAEVAETCGDGIDDDCDGVVDNSCGLFVDGDVCAQNNDCASNFCSSSLCAPITPVTVDCGAETTSTDCVANLSCHWDGDACYEHQDVVWAGSGSNDRLGASVLVAGNWAFAGAPGESALGADAGAVVVYELAGDEWQVHSVLRSMFATPGGKFGAALAFDGTSLAVGEPGNFGGRVSLYGFGGGTWTLYQGFVSEDIGNPASLYGQALAMDGVHLIVGAPGALGGDGAAYVRRRNGGNFDPFAVWSPAAGAGCGIALAADGGKAAVGCASGGLFFYRDLASASSTDYGLGAGSMTSVAFDAVSERFVAGKGTVNGNNGGALLNDYSDPEDFVRTSFGHPTVAPATLFGAGVALQGDTMLVSAPAINEIFRYDVSGTAAMLAGSIEPNGSMSSAAFFGSALSMDYEWAMVGASEDDAAGLRAGSVTFVRRTPPPSLRGPSPTNVALGGPAVDSSPTFTLAGDGVTPGATVCAFEQDHCEGAAISCALADAAGAFTIAVDLTSEPDGAYDLSVSSTDWAGVRSACVPDVVTYTYDTTPPVFNNGSVVLSGAAGGFDVTWDAAADLTDVSYFVNGTCNPIGAGAPFGFSYPVVGLSASTGALPPRYSCDIQMSASDQVGLVTNSMTFTAVSSWWAYVGETQLTDSVFTDRFAQVEVLDSGTAYIAGSSVDSGSAEIWASTGASNLTLEHTGLASAYLGMCRNELATQLSVVGDAARGVHVLDQQAAAAWQTTSHAVTGVADAIFTDCAYQGNGSLYMTVLDDLEQHQGLWRTNGDPVSGVVTTTKLPISQPIDQIDGAYSEMWAYLADGRLWKSNNNGVSWAPQGGVVRGGADMAMNEDGAFMIALFQNFGPTTTDDSSTSITGWSNGLTVPTNIGRTTAVALDATGVEGYFGTENGEIFFANLALGTAVSAETRVNEAIVSLSVDPNDIDTVYAVTASGAVIMSTSGTVGVAP